MAKARGAPLTIVIKLGTSSIVAPTPPFPFHLQLLSSIVETVVKLREEGHRVVLCSSGAIGVGLRRMGLKERGKGLSHKQALAAIGQGRLIALWDNLFSQLDQPIGQILLTRMDISDRTRYLNAQNTFSELLQMGVVPIVNENDTVAVSEIRFGDNDTLSAISSAIVHADYLFLLTDVECLYTDNPRNNPDAKPVRVVRDIEKVKQNVSTTTLGTSLGTGGMSTKLLAAELATAAGVTTVIMHSAHVSDIFEVIKDGPGPCREVSETPRLGGDGDEEGPLCTRFLRHERALRDRKWWIVHGLHTAGTVVIDEGAYKAISRKESGGRLLPAGVVRVDGMFASHQAVRLVVRRKRRAVSTTRALVDSKQSSSSPTSPFRQSQTHTRSSSPSSSLILPTSSTDTIIPSSNQSHTTTSFTPVGSSSPHTTSQPSTPTLNPTASMSSSIASLDPLSGNRSIPASPNPNLHNHSNPASGSASGSGAVSGSGSGSGTAIKAISERLAATTISSALGRELKGIAQTISGSDNRDRDRDDSDDEQHDLRSSRSGLDVNSAGQESQGNVNVEVDHQRVLDVGDEWEEVEVGKGLAQYNSVEIDRIKGRKSSHIEALIGYCESEHVVDSLTLFP